MHESFVTAFAENAEDIRIQLGMAKQLTEDLYDDGHDIGIHDLLDAMARLGVRLAPMENKNIASLAYFYSLSGQNA